MKPIIGIDFGNFQTFVCFISDFVAGTRIGGIVHDLLPARMQDGIPSAYFYSKRIGEVLVGENAVRSRAVPVQNRLRYLKRNLGATTVLDDRTISYDQAITEVIQHCIRSANRVLQSGWQMQTNLISIAYPGGFTSAQRQHLKDLAEKATLEDGTSVKVCGTIAEPAAASLDYLAEYAKSDKDTIVLTYDLGGGTFDLGLVAAYPKGRKNANGQLYYYDIINTRGLQDLGGKEFDTVMFELMKKKISTPLSPAAMANLMELAEQTKVELSTSTEQAPNLFTGDDYIEIPVTQEEFEAASMDLVKRTIEETRKMLNEHKNQAPDVILLTGGASQMPMIKRELEKAFPKYKGKVIDHRPSKAIAYGAARFGTSESNTDPTGKKNSAGVIQPRVMHDIGVRYFHDEDDEDGYVVVFIKAGTPIPYTSEPVSSTKLARGRMTRFRVYEAKGSKPDLDDVDNDFTQIMQVTIDHGKEVPKGHPHESRMTVDRLGMLTIEARDTSVPNMPYEKASIQLENLC